MKGVIEMLNYPQRKSIEITHHAMQRLEERVKTYDGFKSWQHMVKTARYEGRSEENMTDAEYEWYIKHIARCFSLNIVVDSILLHQRRTLVGCFFIYQ